MSLFQKALRKCKGAFTFKKIKERKEFHRIINDIFNFEPSTLPLEFSQLTVQDISNKIQGNECFFYNKINHGFWDHLVYAQKAIKENSNFSSSDFDKRFNSRGLFDDGFVEGLLSLLKEERPGTHFHAVSCQAFSNSEQYVLLPRFSKKEPLVKLMQEYSPPSCQFYNGTMWKDSVLSGEFLDFILSLKGKNLVVVGPESLSVVGDLFEFKSFSHIVIHRTKARLMCKETLNEIIEKHESFNGEHSVFLLQAATLATYFICKLSGKLKNVCMVDVGMALDVFTPDVLRKSFFGKFFHNDMKPLYLDYVPKWQDDENLNEAFFSQVCQAHALDYKSIDEVGSSVNFSEQYIKAYLNLSDDRQVKGFSNIRKAWLAILGAHGQQDEGARWLACASSDLHLHEFPNVTFVDCDLNGVLSLSAVSKVDLKNYDGMIVTNPFGLLGNLDKHINFCQKNNLKIIFDNSYALSTPLHKAQVDEVIVIAQCAFIIGNENYLSDLGDEEVVDENAFRRVNQYLFELPENNLFQKSQYSRSNFLARELGGELLYSSKAIPVNIQPKFSPIVFKNEVISDVDSVFLSRYYKPADISCKNAFYLYEHTVCLSTEKGMVHVSNDDIVLACKASFFTEGGFV